MTRTSHRLERVALALHGARVGVSLACLALALALRSATLGALAGGSLLLACFALNHDLLHAALGFSRRTRHIAMSLTCAAVGLSAHATRVSHLVHHARPLSDDDLEGKSARMPPLLALCAAPLLSAQLRWTSYRRATARDRRVQALEAAANLGLFAALATSQHPACWGFGASLAIGQLFITFWAGHIPHRAPAWLRDLALRLLAVPLFAGSSTLLSFAHHDAHHAHPRVPCHRLARLEALHAVA